MEHSHSCCSAGPVGRRSLLLAGAASLVAFRPTLLRAAPGNYEAMLLSCIDPRTQEPVRDYLAKRGLTGKYSQFTFAGAAIGVVAPKFADWHKTFWENLAASIELHNIKSVIAIDHRDCGAAKIAYGPDSIGTPQKEDDTHRTALAEFRTESTKRHPNLKVETLLMALDGTVMTFS
jgi:carbonic anhydrase